MLKVNCCSSSSKMKVVLSLVLFLQIHGSSAERSVQEDLEEVCAINGGLKAQRDFRNAITDMQQCFGSISTELSSEVEKTGKMESVVGLLCSKLNNVKGCINPYVASFKSCLQKEQHEIVEVSYKVSMAGLQFVCDNSDDIQEALGSKDLNCLTTKTNTLKGCLDKITHSFEAISSQQSVLNSTNELANGIFGNGSMVCSGLLDFQQCSVKAWNECEDKKFTTLLNSMYKYINNEIPCNNLLKSKASTTSVLSLLMLIVPLVFINL